MNKRPEEELYQLVCDMEAILNDKKSSTEKRNTAKQKGEEAWYAWQRMMLENVQRGREAKAQLETEADEAQIHELKAAVQAGRESEERLLNAMMPELDEGGEGKIVINHPIQQRYLKREIDHYRYHYRYLGMTEAHSCCSRGLMAAIERWDTEKSNSSRGIEAYADHWIGQTVQELYRQEMGDMSETEQKNLRAYRKAVKMEESGKAYVPNVKENDGIEAVEDAIKKIFMAATARKALGRSTDKMVDQLLKLYEIRAEIKRKKGVMPYKKTKESIQKKIYNDLIYYSTLEYAELSQHPVMDSESEEPEPVLNSVPDKEERLPDAKAEINEISGSFRPIVRFLEEFWLDQNNRKHVYQYAQHNFNDEPTQAERDRIDRVVNCLIRDLSAISGGKDVQTLILLLNYLINFQPQQRQLQQALKYFIKINADRNGSYIIG